MTSSEINIDTWEVKVLTATQIRLILANLKEGKEKIYSINFNHFLRFKVIYQKVTITSYLLFCLNNFSIFSFIGQQLEHER